MGDEQKVWIRERKLQNGKSKYDLRWICPTEHRWKSRAVKGDHKRAIKDAAKLEEQLADGTYAVTKKITWEAFVKDHVDKIPGKANRTEAQKTLDQFGECTGNPPPRRVTFGMVETFVAWLRTEAKDADGKITREANSQPTINKKLRYLRAALRMAIKRGYIARSPMEGWAWTAEQEPEPRVASDDEIARLLKAAEDLHGFRMRAFIEVALATGARRGELVGLTWDRIDLEGQEVTFTATKGKRNRVVPLEPATVATLTKVKAQTQQDGGPFIGMADNIWHKWPKILEAAKIDHLTIHDLRRTFVTKLARARVSLKTVKELVGHRKIQTTERYYMAVSTEEKREAVKLAVCNVG